MASWAVLLALSDFHYSAPAKTISWSPCINKNNFNCFFSVDSGWGIYSQKIKGKSVVINIDVVYGKLILQTLCLGNICPERSRKDVAVRFIAPVVKVGKRVISADLIRKDSLLFIQFPQPIAIENETLQINLTC
ncbi:hypothetical protein AUJ66_01685 [Candidatus Desantisbacteria bacterium CG1_02_38_46]|uniref:Uncharacterized protein n=3 Tax=unclassified Candidatus Desantisiibacteriota TaxID=3106372 RepID=A0A2H9PAP6_9BACT|nr:MAG: hypothetical protein AUJ66_01685 [Candidatus Desantisbacteria bacterium CG1_02_38_46]PIU50807.1 MAG: hypothetical protein COS91_07720 [Candidatus Desantisbacteria bacterium CG07_land_8_20_14_0_80_39_15]PIZ15639.1 MAG: hypothetical protein COY51_04695 [Candidatus Desantisbacteria bacterium CG_4_10_14_0_8_um_filter_39_17]